MDHLGTSRKSRSFMVVSRRESFAQAMGEVFPEDENTKVVNTSQSLQAMNGRAVDLAFDHDVVIIEADPDDGSELQAIEDLLSNRIGETVFLALTNSDVSITKARKLRTLGIDEVLPLSIDGEELKSVVDEKINAIRASRSIAYNEPSALGQVIPVTQSRGGAGATTIAVNLACSLATSRSSLLRNDQRRRVALLDFDLQFGNANVFLDLEDNGGFLQFIESIEEPDQRFLASILQSHAKDIDVLCAPEAIVPLQSLRSDQVRNMIEILQGQYDYIIVDLPRAVPDWVEPILNKASQLVLVTDTSVPCVRQSRRLIDFYREENVGLPIEIVVNRERQTLIKSDHVREAEKVLETKLTHWMPDNPKVARAAVDLGRPVVDMKPRSDLGKALRKLAAVMPVNEQNAKKSKV